jgi:UDPglucose 6-dehydrogenase
MQVGVYGSGYLATVVSGCLADFGTPVACYDDDAARIYALAQGDVPFHEKNLKEVLRRNVRAGRLVYSTDLESFARKSGVIFLAGDTAAYVEDLALKAAQAAAGNAILVVMTSAPVGTASAIQRRLAVEGLSAAVVSQPIFLTAGCAVEDFNWPDRIVLGTTSPEVVHTLKQVYRPLVMRGVPVIVTAPETAELAREASTAFVATKIAFINELAELCEHVRADAMDLALALGLDKKISPRCLQPGAVFGGAFVETEMDALANLAGGKGVSLRILSAAREVNRSLSERILSKVESMVESLQGKQVGLLGLAFKPNTNSVAGSASLALARLLVSHGAQVRAYDPVAMNEARLVLNGTVRYCDDPYTAMENADAVIVGTGWPEFRALDFDRVKRSLRRPVIVDSKNVLDAHRLRAMGFEYAGVGRG